ncbi:MAG: hypothetical protein V4647_09675 [Pseudomonadota bacterium]
MAIVVIGVLALLLALAWVDGGREEQQLIVQPVELPVVNTEQGA